MKRGGCGFGTKQDQQKIEVQSSVVSSYLVTRLVGPTPETLMEDSKRRQTEGGLDMMHLRRVVCSVDRIHRRCGENGSVAREESAARWGVEGTLDRGTQGSINYQLCISISYEPSTIYYQLVSITVW